MYLWSLKGKKDAKALFERLPESEQNKIIGVKASVKGPLAISPPSSTPQVADIVIIQETPAAPLQVTLGGEVCALCKDKPDHRNNVMNGIRIINRLKTDRKLADPKNQLTLRKCKRYDHYLALL